MEKVYFKTFGCSNNLAETEIMQGLVKDNFELTNDESEAQVIVLNICTVKGDDSALDEIKTCKENHPYKKLVVGGCIPFYLMKRIRKISDDCAIMTTDHINEINQVIEEVLNDNPVELVGREDPVKINLPRVRKNKIIGIVPISNSCVGTCTYCSVRGIKGKFYSFPEDKILKEVKSLVEDGCKEIWITSQDNGCYGLDINTNLANLLNKILSIEGDFYIRIGMMNPNTIKPYLDDLIEVFKNKKVFKFIHLPLQSASDKILEKMGRKYKYEEFKYVLDKFREVVPHITFSTDIIAGFPTESEEDHKKNLDFLRNEKPDILNLAQYRNRPETPASKFKPLNSQTVKDRSREISNLFEWIGFEVNKKWADWQGVVMIDEEGKNDTMIGRNAYYKPVVVPKNDYKIGDKVKVKVSKVTKNDLRANF